MRTTVIRVLAVYTLLAVLFAGQVRLDYMYAQVPVSWGGALLLSATDWYLWALLTPVIWTMGRRFPFRSGHLASAIAVHGAVSIALTVAKPILQTMVGAALTGLRRQPASLLRVYVTLLTYWVILGIGAALSQMREQRARELRASHLETELARAQLDALRMRLNPHFLFNTLNGVSALMRENVEAADLMLTRLSDLLRLTLDRADVQEVPLTEELDFVRQYLAIQQIRFGDRLTVTIDAAPDTLSIAVPSLSLQPLVENALRHGVERKRGAATIAIVARRTSGRLEINIRDDGPGPPGVVQTGTGLDTTRRRLAHLHGAAANLVLRAADGGGALATLTLPAIETPSGARRATADGLRPVSGP